MLTPGKYHEHHSGYGKLTLQINILFNEADIIEVKT